MRGVKSSRTTMKSTVCFCPLAVVTFSLALPDGMTFVPFHMRRVVEVGSICLDVTLLWFMTFTAAPLSTWNFTFLSLTVKVANNELALPSCTVSMSSVESSSCSSTLATVLVLLHTVAKWFRFLHLLQVWFHAGHACLVRS
uniref:Uncharacterized protein n=1 Tax=Ixodes ricinus TaxID=34613 RepID=A0A6B0UT99_IXORI